MSLFFLCLSPFLDAAVYQFIYSVNFYVSQLMKGCLASILAYQNTLELRARDRLGGGGVLDGLGMTSTTSSGTSGVRANKRNKEEGLTFFHKECD